MSLYSRVFADPNRVEESVLGALGTAALAGGAAAAGVKTYRAIKGAMDRRKQEKQARSAYDADRSAVNRSISKASDRIAVKPEASQPVQQPAQQSGFKKPTLRMYSAR